MGEATQRWQQEIRGLLSLAAFVLSIAFIFQSLELALLITAALGVHELGHVVAISLFGIDWQIGFGIVGAWTSTPTDERTALGHFSNAIIHLTGPFFNLFYALTALLVHRIAGLNQAYWLRLANLSATVALFNGLPIGRISDGGKAIERTFSSLDKRAERWLLPAPVLWLLSLLWLVVVTPSHWIGLLAFALIGLWFVIGMLRASLLDDPANAASPQAMTRNQGFLVTSSIIVLLLASTGIVLLTPLWLTEDHVFGMIGGLARKVIRPLFVWLQETIRTVRAILLAL
jgi:hypothetical protein